MVEKDKIFTLTESQVNAGKTIQTGMNALKQLENVPENAGLNWTHPTGDVFVANDPTLRKMMAGGVEGAFRELRDEGLGDYAQTIVDFTRSQQ